MEQRALAALHGLAAVLGSTSDTDHKLALLPDAIQVLEPRAAMIAVFVRDPGRRGELRQITPIDALLPGFRASVMDSLLTECVQTRSVVRARPQEADDRTDDRWDCLTIAPVTNHKNHVFAVVAWLDESDNPIDDAGRALVETLLAWAGYVLGYAREVEQLQMAVESQRFVGQAVGLIMATESHDATSAFAYLSTKSQRSNRKLRDVAQDTIDAHERGLTAPDAAVEPDYGGDSPAPMAAAD